MIRSLATDVKIRSRNAVVTRQAILDAAREHFIARSYEDVGMREVAREVGVDAALVSRYFGSKEDLFIEALDSCKHGRELWEGDRADFGRRIAREVVLNEFDGADLPCDGNRMGGMLILLRSIGSAKAMDIVEKRLNPRFFDPLIDWLGGDQAKVRAHLLAGMIMGMTISRELAGGFATLSRDEREALCTRMGASLQAVVDGQ